MHENYKLKFGKHYGKKLTEIPRDYLIWLSKQEGWQKSPVSIFLKTNTDSMELSDEEKAISKAPKHPNYYGLKFTDD